MKIGLPLTVPVAEVGELATRAEALGVESVWVFDHLIWPASYEPRYPYTDSGRPPVPVDVPTHDVWVFLAAVAGVTSTIKLGTSIYILPLRDPIVTARAVSTLDVVSGGRVILGAGVGWLREEFDIAGFDFDTRGKRTNEIAAAIRCLWSEAVPEFHGEHVDFPPVIFEPKPPQGGDLPIHFSGESTPGLRRAATLGQGWIGLNHTVESARERVGQLRQLRADNGLTSTAFDVTVGATWPLDEDDVRRFAEAGVTRLCVVPWRRNANWRDSLHGLERIVDVAAEADGPDAAVAATATAP